MRRFLTLPNVIFTALALGALCGWLVGNSSPIFPTGTLGKGELILGPGMAVESVAPGSRAAAAGLKPGDVLTTLDGQPLASPADFRERVRERGPGAAVALGFRRDRADQTVQVPLASVFIGSEWLRETLTLGGDLFKQLILMVVMPLVIFSLICGMMSIGNVRRLGRVAGKTLALYLVTATLACVVAIALVNVLKPGGAVSQERRDELAKQYEADQKKIVGELEKSGHSPWSFARSLVPKNVVDSIAKGQMLPVIFFALLFGLTATMLDDKRRNLLYVVFDVINDVMIRMVGVVMWTAPIGVFCLIAVAVATIGVEVFRALALYCGVVILGLVIQFFVVYGGIIKLLTRLRFVDFVRACRPALATAFSTSSSAASLPVNMECVSKRLNVSNSVTSFVLPIGTTVNMDGTAIMQSVAAVFIAQIYSMNLGIGDQLRIILTAMLAAIGTAPVPSAGIAMLVLILEPLKIPLEGIALIWAVDRPLDMLRTVVNVVGDGVAAAAVASTEGEDVRYVPESALSGSALERATTVVTRDPSEGP